MERRTVFFVDDEVGVLSSLKRLLRKEPYKSIFVQSEKEVLGLLEKERVHVIVADLNMPEMGGMALLQQVKERYPDIIRMILSGTSENHTILKAINKGNVYRYIVKPWNDGELKLAVMQAIDLFNLQQERRDLLKKLEDHNFLLEKRVQERTRQLLSIQSQAEIGKYASQIVHNLNNPLQSIMGGLDLTDFILSSDNPNLNELREYLGIIKSGAFGFKKIISGILDHVRGKKQHKTERIDINEIIKIELDFFNLNPIYKHQIEKHINLSDGLPHILGNPIQIKQVIDNLLSNAIDAMENSTKKKLTIETRLNHGTVIMIISDTGEGIPAENLTKIFSSNFTTKPIGKGTGLGLASVKTMVEAYAGDIRVESKDGQGAAFIVRIPVERRLA